MLISVLVCCKAFSQNKYPQVKIIDGDTVTLISMQQVKKINLAFIDLKECDTLRTIDAQQIQELKHTVFSQNKIVVHQKHIILNDSLIQKQLAYDNSQLLNSINAQKKELKRTKTRLTVSLVLNAVLAVTGMFLAIR